MRWIIFIPVAYAAIVIQTSLIYALRLPVGFGGLVLGMDFTAAVAVALALRIRGGVECMLAAWVLGLLVDLTSLGLPVGTYALGYAAGAALVFRTRSAVFGDNPITQGLLGVSFCLIAHGWAASLSGLYLRGPGARLGADLAQAVLVSLCTAVMVPLVCRILRPVNGVLLIQTAGRR